MLETILFFLIVAACKGQTLSLDLQSGLIRYGTFVEAVYNQSMTSELPDNGYAVRTYFYSSAHTSSWSTTYDPVLIGFIAFSSSANEITVVLRNTMLFDEWLSNIVTLQVPFPFLNGTNSNANVHEGFLNLYLQSAVPGASSLRQQIMDGLAFVYNNKGTGTRVTLVGHSLGGALATICAFDIVNSNLGISNAQVQVYTFGSPMVGDETFKDLTDDLNIIRVADQRDIVPYLPALDYVQTGIEFSVDGCKFQQQSSSSGSIMSEIEGYHSMDRYLRTVSSMPASSGTIPGEHESTRKIYSSIYNDVFQFLSTFFKSVPATNYWQLLEGLSVYIYSFSAACS